MSAAVNTSAAMDAYRRPRIVAKRSTPAMRNARTPDAGSPARKTKTNETKKKEIKFAIKRLIPS